MCSSNSCSGFSAWRGRGGGDPSSLMVPQIASLERETRFAKLKNRGQTTFFFRALKKRGLSLRFPLIYFLYIKSLKSNVLKKQSMHGTSVLRLSLSRRTN